MHWIFWLIPGASLVALVMAWVFFRQMMRADEGTEMMKKVASHVRKGAIAYLRQQYKVVGLVFVVMSVLLAILSYGFHLQNNWLPFAFLTGGFYSGLAGFFGMKAATYASARTAQAASRSINRGLKMAFRSGAVMGLVVVGLALFDYAFWYAILNHFLTAVDAESKTILLTTIMVTFGLGGSLQALFARVGGGIFTKAADVGADLVGKVEAGIPEDDPRNPAVIADNVGDNVGDIAGMGADLYESFYGTMLAAASLGALAFMRTDLQLAAALAPAAIAAIGTMCSLIGMFCVGVRGKGKHQHELFQALDRGIHVTSIGIVVASLVLIKLLHLPLGVWGALVSGLLSGILIGKSTEHYTSHAHGPTKRVSAHSQTGAATVIIGGIGEGLLSTAYPVLAIVTGTALAFCFTTGFDFSKMSLGLYGVAIAAVGMLSTLGITLATDAYGPIADNAGGNAQMSGLPPLVRKRTDSLDAVGNTTAATGKGFSIGSAALTALALMAAYIEELRVGLERMGTAAIDVHGHMVSLKSATIVDLMYHFQVHLMNPKVILGIFLGSMTTFVFCGLSIKAVARAAAEMVEEVRRQFKEMAGIMTGEQEPDYERCVIISTSAAQRAMFLPALCAVAVPVAVGLLLGVPAVFGLLAGTVSTGFCLAIFMANSGGAWDNAKKFIEEGNFGGKGSDAHKAAIVGDTVGDPFKDTAGPSLNILIKLMTFSAIVTAGLVLVCHL